jgi:predicted DCC family thiol-disulfide oxidoreductase YuxK
MTAATTATVPNTTQPNDLHAGHAVVLFDGACPFCRKSVELLGRLDWFRRLRFENCRDVSKHPPTAQPLVMKDMLEEMHVVPPARDRFYKGFRAFRWISWRLPLTLPLAPFLYVPGVPYLGSVAYRWIAKNRYKIIPCKDGVCQLPTR